MVQVIWDLDEASMSCQRSHRKIERTSREQRRLAKIRERFQRERPGLEDLLASGDAAEVASLGEYLDLRVMLAALKEHREKHGLSLADIAARSGMDRAAVSRLENGVYLNPTLDTLHRYAEAVGAEIGFNVRVV
jgi:DNA-binding XRE family transcriptional regulator